MYNCTLPTSSCSGSRYINHQRSLSPCIPQTYHLFSFFYQEILIKVYMCSIQEMVPGHQQYLQPELQHDHNTFRLNH